MAKKTQAMEIAENLNDSQRHNLTAFVSSEGGVKLHHQTVSRFEKDGLLKKVTKGRGKEAKEVSVPTPLAKKVQAAISEMTA